MIWEAHEPVADGMEQCRLSAPVGPEQPVTLAVVENQGRVGEQARRVVHQGERLDVDVAGRGRAGVAVDRLRDRDCIEHLEPLEVLGRHLAHVGFQLRQRGLGGRLLLLGLLLHHLFLVAAAFLFSTRHGRDSKRGLQRGGPAPLNPHGTPRGTSVYRTHKSTLACRGEDREIVYRYFCVPVYGNFLKKRESGRAWSLRSDEKLK